MFMPFMHEVNEYMADNNDDGINDTAVDFDIVVVAVNAFRRDYRCKCVCVRVVWNAIVCSLNACVSVCRQNIVNVARIHFYD